MHLPLLSRIAVTEIRGHIEVGAVAHVQVGLPLALELAAAHARLLSPNALLSRIDGRLGAGLTAADPPRAAAFAGRHHRVEL